MSKQNWLDLGPRIILALGIMLAAQLSVLAAHSGALVLIGPATLALAVVVADGTAGRLAGQAFMPKPASLIMAGTIMVAGTILLPQGARALLEMIPFMGIAALLTSQQWTQGRVGRCGAQQTLGE